MSQTPKTPMLTRAEGLDARRWYIIDAKDAVLGRVATRVATILRGKNKATFTPNQDCGDFVIVVNAGQVKLTGKKLDQKQYHHHSGYPGGIYSRSARRQLEEFPERVIESAVRGMLPKNRLGRALAAKLKVYREDQHPHAAQQPESISI